MVNLGTDFIGRLPPGAEEVLKESLETYRELERQGILKGVEIAPPSPGCAVAEAQAGTVYTCDNLPSLPLPGCQRSPCCACDYLPVVK